MRARLYKPIVLTERDLHILEKDLSGFFYESLFLPVVDSIKQTKEVYFNSISAIEDAIRSGRIQYFNNTIRGDFNSRIVKEFDRLGYKFDNRMKGYRVTLEKLPSSIQRIIAQTASNYQKMGTSIISSLDNIDIEQTITKFNIADKLEGNFDKALDNIDKQFRKTIGLDIVLTPEQRQVVTKEFTENLLLKVKDFTAEQTLKLRAEAEEATLSGIRSKSFSKILQDRFNISKKKASFLSFQEINLFTAKYKEAKYTGAGITQYKWSTSKDNKVRHDHQELDGKIFFFSSPPIVNKETGKRANPSEDYGCRCKAIPIVPV